MPHFRVHSQILSLELDQPFTIARGTKTSVDNVLVTLASDGLKGYGEAAPNTRYNEDAEKVIAFVQQFPISELDDVDVSDQLDHRIEEITAKNLPLHLQSVESAKSAIEMAWLDWWGKSRQEPLWKLWQTPGQSTPISSYTIGLDEIEVMQQKVQKAAEFPILKVKLGTDRDKEIINAIRSVTDKPIRVDANEGWKDLATAKQFISFLADQNIEIVEQPLPAAQKEPMRKLKKWSPLPLMADESFKGSENLSEISEQFDGINIKLMKIGSLVKAKRVIAKAKKRGLEVMIGCMVESSLAISAGALLGTWADYVDLDGGLLLKDDPFEGLSFTPEKRIFLDNSMGLTVHPKEPFHV